MSTSVRRSSRANKGQPPKRPLEEDYDLQVNLVLPSSSDVPVSKKAKAKHGGESFKFADEHEQQEEEGIEEDYEGEVRCLPCKTTKANYDEDKDEGGMMIQCDKCKNWQHALCMGLKPDAIPKNYLCIECQTSSQYSVKNLKDSARLSIAKAYYNMFRGIIPEDYKFELGFDRDSVASKWSLELEEAIHNEFPKAKDRYTNECRRVLFLLRKPNVSQQILDHKITFEQLVKMKPEELDSTLKTYADKVRQDAIRRTVIVVEDNEQRVRRTHKGEEIVESISSNQHNDEGDSGIISRSVDHRIFKDDSLHKSDIKVEGNNRQSYHNFDNEDEDNIDNSIQNEEEEEAESAETIRLTSTKNGKSSSSESSDIDNVPEIDIEDDDDLNFIITGKRKSDEKQKKTLKPQNTPNLPLIILGRNLWTGHIVFPEFSSFEARGDFYSCSNYVEPTSVNGVRTHNKFISVAKELLTKNDHNIEGRLDRKVADDYLNKVITTRDLYLIQLTCVKDQLGFDRLNNYLLNKNKVGVLSGKPSFVKDAYIISIDFNDPLLPDYLAEFKSDIMVGLFAVFVVKKDYTPAPPGILKKTTSTASSGPDLQAILNQLGSKPMSSLDSQDQAHYHASFPVTNGSSSILSTLTIEQRKVLDDICARNPEIAANPEGALQLVSQYIMNGGNGGF